MQKQIEKLQLLLNKGYIVKALDKNSDSKMADPKLDRKLFGWDSLFKVLLYSFIGLEISSQCQTSFLRYRSLTIMPYLIIIQ